MGATNQRNDLVAASATVTGDLIVGDDLTVDGDAAVTGAVTAASATITDITLSNDLTIADAGNIIVNATTGTKIGTATTQKIGFYNATPVAKQTGVAVTAEGIHAALVALGLIGA